MTETTHENVLRVVVINAGVSERSSTRMLAGRIAQEFIDQLHAAGVDTMLHVIDLGPLAGDVAKAIVAGGADGAVAEALDKVAKAEAVIAATPVYNAGLSGIFKSFVDLMEKDHLLARPMILAASAGSARHAMVLDNQMRPLFAFMRAMPMPTAIFATPGDWGTPDLDRRITRAANELAAFTMSGVDWAMASEAGGPNLNHPASSDAVTEQNNGTVVLDVNLARHRRTLERKPGHKTTAIHAVGADRSAKLG